MSRILVTGATGRLGGRCSLSKSQEAPAAKHFIALMLAFLLVFPCAHHLGADDREERSISPEVQARLGELRSRGEPVTLDDLTAEPIPDEENAAALCRQAFAAYVAPDEEVKQLRQEERWSPEEAAKVRAWLGENQETLDLLRDASALEKCRFVERYLGYEQELPHLGQVRDMCFLLVSSASLLARDGRAAPAMKESLSGVRLALHVGQEGTWFAYIFQVDVLRRSLRPLQDILPQAELEEAERAEVGAALEDAMEHSDARPSVLENRALNLDLLTKPRKEILRVVGLEEWGGPERADWLDSEIIHMLDAYNELLALADRPFFEVSRELEKGETRLWSSGKAYPLTAMVLPAAYLEVQLQAQMRAALLEGLLAVELEERRRSTGAYPDALADLRPRQGAKVPVDPFAGQLFVYKKQAGGYILYSIGPNGRDDGGRSDRNQGFDDIAWTVDLGNGGEQP